MEDGEHGIMTWMSLTSQGTVDIRKTDGRIQYVTMPFSRLSHILRSSPVSSLVVRVFDKVNPSSKRIYSFLVKGEIVLKLTPEVCEEQNCTDSTTGMRIDPEPDCRYL
jgi:hypothetical protein